MSERITALCFYANGAWHALEDDDPQRMGAVESGERGWHFNDGRLQITLGVPGDAQESSFMNATLQSTENEPNLEFSIAVHVEVPAAIKDEEALADYLGSIFGQIRHDHPELHVEIQLGPEGRGDE